MLELLGKRLEQAIPTTAKRTLPAEFTKIERYC